jgi:hypothetical protein
MADTSRRGFLKTASLGAAAMGMLGFLPTIASADNSTCAPPASMASGLTTAPVPANGMPAVSMGGMPAPTAPVVVYIDNPASGQGVIFVGEQRFELNNPALIQALTAAIA